MVQCPLVPYLFLLATAFLSRCSLPTSSQGFQSLTVMETQNGFAGSSSSASTPTIQTIQLRGSGISGYFTLGYGGYSTSMLYSSSSATRT